MEEGDDDPGSGTSLKLKASSICRPLNRNKFKTATETYKASFSLYLRLLSTPHATAARAGRAAAADAALGIDGEFLAVGGEGFGGHGPGEDEQRRGEHQGQGGAAGGKAHFFLLGASSLCIQTRQSTPFTTFQSGGPGASGPRPPEASSSYFSFP